MSKPKTYRFLLQVDGATSQKHAESKVLYAFASRAPDGVKFFLKSAKEHKQTWMDGAKAGTEIAFDLLDKTLENLRKTCGIPKKTK